MNATSPPADPEPVITYYPGPAACSGGIKAAWHLKIVTGKEAAVLLEMQNQAILDLLTWAAEHEKPTSQNTSGRRETGVNSARKSLELAA